MMKRKNQLIIRLLICCILAVITSVYCISLFPLHSAAKTRKPTWKKEISSLEVGKTYRYRIKHRPKNTRVRFYSNHKSLAAINSKTGLLRAKKKGSVRITAKISQTNKKSRKIKTRIRIIRKKTSRTGKRIVPDSSPILNHVNFSIAESINPWNHSVILYSSRILLQSEVQNTEVTLTPSTVKTNAKTVPTLTAQFSSLSADGKTVTYQLNADSKKQLCPGNGSQDGEYKITGTFFQDTLLTQYHERIRLNSIHGFILNSDQSSLSNVSVKLYSDLQNNIIATTTTDQNGYYQFQDITEKNVTLKTELEGYEPHSASIQNSAGQNICQNILLHPSSSAKNLAISCQILNEQNQPIKNASVILTAKNAVPAAASTSDTKQLYKEQEKLVLSGQVDNNGLISFGNQKKISLHDFTKIEHHSNQSLPEYLHDKMPVSDIIICDSLHPLTYNQDYTLYVFPSTDGSTIPMNYQMESLSFSFDPLLSEQLFLQVKLQELPVLSAKKLSIYTDSSTDSVINFFYSLYDNTGKKVFQTTFIPLSKDNENDYSKQLTAALQNENIRLPDGSYYASVTAHTNFPGTESISTDTKNSLSETAFLNSKILPVQIQNNTISDSNFTLTPCRSYQVLAYTDFYDASLEKASFILYQKLDTIWFPVGEYTTDLFSPIHSGQKAYLRFPVSSDTSYCLMPLSPEYKITSGVHFNIPHNQKTITSANTPEHQILLSLNPDHESIKKDSPNLSDLLEYRNLCSNKTLFPAEFFSNSVTYPNTVYAFYQENGTFTSLLFATPSFSTLENISSTLIYDQLQNGMNILTSQKSYSATPFFVT